MADVSDSYVRTRAALAAVSAGTGYAKIGLLGDSTMAGAKAGPAGAAVRTSTPVTFLRDKLLAAQARPVIASNWIGDQRFQVTNSITPYTFDTRFSQPDGAGFIASTGATPVSVAGSLLVNTATANRTGFLPEVATDTTDVYYPVNTTLGAFSVARSGGSTVQVNQAGTSGMGKITYTSPLNSVDPIYISRTSGGAYVIGMDSYNSAIKSIRLFGLGWSGGRAADWAGTVTGFDPLNGLVALGLDLVVLRFGTNDISIPGATSTSTNPTAYQESINKIIDALLAAGTNVILATHYPMNTAVTSQTVQDTYAGYVRAIATARNLMIHDTYARVGTWAAANAAGKVFDNLHPNAAGYQDDAEALSATLVAMAATTSPPDSSTPPTFTRSVSRTIIVGEVPGSFEQDGRFWSLTDPKKPTGSIDPDSKIDITFDWTKVLADIDAGIADIEFDIAGLTAGGAYGTGVFATIFVSNATGPASITCRITTDSIPPRIEDRTVFLTVEQH